MKKQLITLAALAGGFVIGASALVALADTTGWTSAPATPPNGNVAAPINVGGGDYPSGDSRNYAQIKTGVLGLSDLLVTRLNTADGPVAANQVLTALDANGTVGWRAAGGGGGNFVMVTNSSVQPSGGAYNSASVACPSGSVVVGGGGGDSSYTMIMYQSVPYAGVDSTGTVTNNNPGWTVGFTREATSDSVNNTAKVYAICATN